MVLDSCGSLQSSEDLIWLWFEGPHVSRQSRHGMDTLFKSTYLPATGRHYELGKIPRYVRGETR